MENASKALLIAAAVLIAIVLIALGVSLLKTGGDTSDEAKEIGEGIDKAIDDQTTDIILQIGTPKEKVFYLANKVFSQPIRKVTDLNVLYNYEEIPENFEVGICFLSRNGEIWKFPYEMIEEEKITEEYIIGTAKKKLENNDIICYSVCYDEDKNWIMFNFSKRTDYEEMITK